jgi:hypothetical protein
MDDKNKIPENEKMENPTLDNDNPDNKALEERINTMLEDAMKKTEEATAKIIAEAEKKAAKIIKCAEDKVSQMATEGRGPSKPLRTVREEPKVKIKLPYDKVKNNTDLPVSINGVTYLLQRGKWIEVPLAVAEVLDNANRQEEYAIQYSEGLAKAFEEKLKEL